MQEKKEAEWLNRQQFPHQGKKTHPNNKTQVHGIIEKTTQTQTSSEKEKSPGAMKGKQNILSASSQ